MASSVNFGTQQYFGFDPRTIPGCSLWLDAADSNSLTLSGSNVTAWADKSGNAYSAATYSGTITRTTQNGQPALNFGTGVMKIGSYAWSSYSSMFIVASAATGNFFIVQSRNDNEYLSFVYTGNWNLAQIFDGTTKLVLNDSVIAQGTPIVGSNQFFLLGFGYNGGTSSSFYTLNGSSRATTLISGSGLSNATTTGQPLYINGRWSGSFDNSVVCEILQFSRSLSSTERQQIEGYLAWKWGLRGNLPTGHPFRSAPPIMRAFQPLDVTLPSLWLDAADARTLTLSGSNVTAWTDKTRGTAITIGGSGGLTSTSNDVTTSPARTSYFTVPVDIRRSVTPNLSAFIVYAWLGQSSGTDQVFWGNDNPNNQNRAQFFTFPIFPTINFAYLLAGGLYLINTSVLNTSATQLYTAIEQVGVTNGTAVYVNGALGPAGTGTASSNTSFAGNEILYFGGGETASIYPSYTQFREIVFYSSALTTSERQQVEGYLAHKWGLRGSLPATHPFRTFFPTTPLFVPTQISGVSLWLDAADATTLTLSGSNVTTWADKSGNGRNTTTAFGSPTYSTTALNSRPAVSFNSTAFRGNFAFTGTQLHCFIVTTMAQNGAFPRLLSLGNTTQTDYDVPQTCIPFTIDFGTANLRVVRNNTAVNAAFPAFNTPFLGVSAQYANTQEVGVNGQIVPNTVGTGTSAAFGITQYGIGIHVGTNGEQTFVGSIGEILVYGSYLTTSQRQQVEGYLAWKWGLQNNLPSTHPYAKVRP